MAEQGLVVASRDQRPELGWGRRHWVRAGSPPAAWRVSEPGPSPISLARDPPGISISVNGTPAKLAQGLGAEPLNPCSSWAAGGVVVGTAAEAWGWGSSQQGRERGRMRL